MYKYYVFMYSYVQYYAEYVNIGMMDISFLLTFLLILSALFISLAHIIVSLLIVFS